MGHYETLGAHPTILPSNEVTPSLPLNKDFLVFHYVRALALYEPPSKGPPLTTPFCSASTHTIKPEPGSNTTCWGNLMDHSYPHLYDIVHSKPKPSWFCFWASPPKDIISNECYLFLHTYKPSHSYLMWAIVRLWVHIQHFYS